MALAGAHKQGAEAANKRLAAEDAEREKAAEAARIAKAEADIAEAARIAKRDVVETKPFAVKFPGNYLRPADYAKYTIPIGANSNLGALWLQAQEDLRQQAELVAKQEQAERDKARAAWRPATEAQRTALIKAVKASDAAETIAFRSLAGVKLSAVEEGARLADAHKIIAALKANNTYIVSRLLNWKSDGISVNDLNRAKVRVTESWDSSFWDSQTNLCSFRYPAHLIPQTIYLRLNDAGRWKVTEVKPDHVVEPVRLPCEN